MLTHTDGLATGGLTIDAGFEWCDLTEIPLLGVVAAGEPYQAFAVEETLGVPTTLWGGKSVFALRVRGTSMIDEGIHNGDYLIVEPRAVAENGQTVVAEIDGGVTVKKYYREPDGQVRLQPANPEMLPLVIRGDHIRIIGVVAGIVRKFGFGEAHRNAAPRAAARPVGPASVPPRHAVDTASLDLEINVIDSQLVRWTAAVERVKRDKRLQHYAAEMEQLTRDLQALREWCARTRKAGLRRALLTEANRVIRRMQRFASSRAVELPDLVLH